MPKRNGLRQDTRPVRRALGLGGIRVQHYYTGQVQRRKGFGGGLQFGQKCRHNGQVGVGQGTRMVTIRGTQGLHDRFQGRSFGLVQDTRLEQFLLHFLQRTHCFGRQTKGHKAGRRQVLVSDGRYTGGRDGWWGGTGRRSSQGGTGSTTDALRNVVGDLWQMILGQHVGVNKPLGRRKRVFTRIVANL